MQINWHTIKKNGDLLIQIGHPSTEFWKHWMHSRESMAKIGISLYKAPNKDGIPTWEVKRISSISGAALPPANIPPPFDYADKTGLKFYQVEPVSQIAASLLTNRVAFDASDTGTGKTFTALKAVAILNRQPAIICTKNAIAQWKNACKHFNLTPVFVYNWESSIGRVYKKEGRIQKIAPPQNSYLTHKLNEYRGDLEYSWRIPKDSGTVLIFDEIHKGNGNDSSMAAIVHAAVTAEIPIIGLSATLLDRLEKFQMVGRMTKALENKSFVGWLMEQGCFIDKYDRWQATDEKNVLKKINTFLFPQFGARVKKSDIPGFPECDNYARLCSIDNAKLIQKEYEKISEQINILLKKTTELPTNKEMQIRVLRLRYRQMAELQKVPLFYDVSREYIESGHTVIIFVWFDQTLKALVAKFKTNCYICGSQDLNHRTEVLKTLQSDKTRVVICNMQAGGTAIDGLQDLTGRHPRVGILSPGDDAVITKQALGRVHRANSATKSQNVLLYAAGTVEEKVFENVKNKLNNIDILNDGDLADPLTFINHG
jgi:superfamily II DNA or RNA helicase